MDGGYDFDNGYALSASIGKRFGEIEGEVSYRENDLDSLTLCHGQRHDKLEALLRHWMVTTTHP